MDSVIWKARPQGGFTIKEAWKALSPECARVSWAGLIWGKGYIPRFSFVTWIALQNRLYTCERLFAWGVSPSNLCPVCNSEIETVKHLFFQCSVYNAVLLEVLKLCRITRGTLDWRREISWFERRARGKTLLSRIRRTALCAAVYYV